MWSIISGNPPGEKHCRGILSGNPLGESSQGNYLGEFYRGILWAAFLQAPFGDILEQSLQHKNYDLYITYYIIYYFYTSSSSSALQKNRINHLGSGLVLSTTMNSKNAITMNHKLDIMKKSSAFM